MAGTFNAPKTYSDTYNEEIAPKIMAIDLFLKEREQPITIWQVSQLLDMSYIAVEKLIYKLDITGINHTNIFRLISLGTSQVCRLIQREALLGFPSTYTAKDISFIYEIDELMVLKAFEILGVEAVSGTDITRVFDLLPAHGRHC